ncbi:MAG: excinuclease ABC subunit UvrA, partial [Muribaculaceae bacterium]|nr:excinuclease ABC subunit UvrA [Muribaculaceae bacterium]
STVGTSTEIYDYLRLLFARIGKTYSPVSGEQVKKHTTSDVIDAIKALPDGTRFALLAPIHVPSGRSRGDQLDVLLKGGYSRVEENGKFMSITDAIMIADEPNHSFRLLVDRLAAPISYDDELRLRDSITTAFYEGQEECIILAFNADGSTSELQFSKRFEADGITFKEPSDLMFNFNNPIGACDTCEGFGNIVGVDENLVVPNKTLSVYDDAVMCWRGQVMSEWKNAFIRLASKYDFPIHKPYYQLTKEQHDLLWHGCPEFPGIDGFFEWIKSKSYSIQYRVLMARYRGKTICPTCHGSRLKADASYVKINDKSIGDLVHMPIDELAQWFKDLKLESEDAVIAKRLLTEINNRLSFLMEVGLPYLTLDRLSGTLSGGESQRINLATSLGSTLVGSIYILDEPSIGLHPRDNDRLIHVLRMLQELGNTVVVVEHDEEIMRAADYIIDMGPEAGRLGGEVVYQGTIGNLKNIDNSFTLKYLTGEMKIALPSHRRHWNNYIEVKGAAQNNLKGIDVKFPLGVMTVVTGVSGSGKSTLVNDILFKALARQLGESADAPGTYSSLGGDIDLVKAVEFVDQDPIGKSSRSNPAIYLKAFDEIRHLFAQQQLSKQMGYNAGFFSFNSPGGRCEECKGDGKITIEMQFMANITLTCDTCHGRRFSNNALEVTYRDKSIYDVLEMTVNQAIEFFSQANTFNEKKIVARLKPLQDVGLGYIKLGQSSSTLSGGENQRVKLASFLSGEKKEHTLFIFDEPTTGLHFHDINTLMKSFNQLIDRGHTIIIIEHNLDVIKCADHIIDLGPEGGVAGGSVVVTGTPEDVAKHGTSHTAQWLRKILN